MTNPASTTAPPRERETHAQGFARLRVLRLSLEKTLDEMGAVLDAVEAPPVEGPPRKPNASGMADELDAINELVDAAYLASGDLVDFQRGAMRGLLDLTSDKLRKVRSEFAETYCGGYVDV